MNSLLLDRTDLNRRDGIPSTLLVWHEAGNALYFDRFRELQKILPLTVVGPARFRGKKFGIEGIPTSVTLLPTMLGGHWLTYFMPRLITRLFRSEYDAIYVHEEPHSMTAFICAVLKGKRRFVLESSAINLRGSFRRLNLLERFVYSRADVILPKNAEVASVLRRRGADGGKIGTEIGNGVSEHSFYPLLPSDASRMMMQLCGYDSDKNANRLRVGYAGRIWEAKGLRILLDIKRALDVDVFVCGSMVDEALVHDLREGGVFVIKELDMGQLRAYYSFLDIFILPSLATKNWREQFGRVCVEAIYCGTTAIGSSLGGIPDIVGREQTFSPGSPQEAIALIQRLTSPHERDRVLGEQKKRVDDTYSWASIARQVKRALGPGLDDD